MTPDLTPRLVETFTQVLRVLNEGGVTYACIGGLARNAWGSARTTTDIDIEVAVSPERFATLVEHMEQAGLKFERSVGPSEKTDPVPDQLAFRGPGDVRVDLLLTKTPFQEEALRRRRRAQVLDVPCWVASPEDLVVYKLVAFRGRDIDDIEDVIRTQQAGGKPIDRDYIGRWAEAWGVADRWLPLRSRLKL